MKGEKITTVCPCGKSFEDYVSNKRSKFCSLKCYWVARRTDTKYKGYWTGKKRLGMAGENNPKWKGNEVGYLALHAWVYRQLGTPSKCDFCLSTDRKWYHWSNISGLYKRDVKDWQRLCVPCHSKFDKTRV